MQTLINSSTQRREELSFPKLRENSLESGLFSDHGSRSKLWLEQRIDTWLSLHRTTRRGPACHIARGTPSDSPALEFRRFPLSGPSIVFDFPPLKHAAVTRTHATVDNSKHVLSESTLGRSAATVPSTISVRESSLAEVPLRPRRLIWRILGGPMGPWRLGGYRPARRACQRNAPLR